jgi:hypothetical protein
MYKVSFFVFAVWLLHWTAILGIRTRGNHAHVSKQREEEKVMKLLTNLL